MATATLRKAISKVTSALEISEDPITYYIDRRGLSEWQRVNDSIRHQANNIIGLYKEISGFTIQTIEQAEALKNNPLAYFKADYYNNHEKDFENLVRLKLDFSAMIPVPENFDDLVRACAKFKGNFRDYEFQNGFLQFTAHVLEKRDRKFHCVATTKTEKRNLEIANDIMRALKALEETLDPGKFSDAIKSLKYAHPLPYQLRIVQGDNGPELSANPKWVSETWGGTAFLGKYVLTSGERKMLMKNNLPPDPNEPKWVKFKRTTVTGDTREFLCPQSELEKHLADSDVIYDGFFTEAGDPWGVKVDRTRARTVKETIYTPIK